MPKTVSYAKASAAEATRWKREEWCLETKPVSPAPSPYPAGATSLAAPASESGAGTLIDFDIYEIRPGKGAIPVFRGTIVATNKRSAVTNWRRRYIVQTGVKLRATPAEYVL